MGINPVHAVLLVIVAVALGSIGANGQEPEKKWCVPKPAAVDGALVGTVDYICGLSQEFCKAVEPGGACYIPDEMSKTRWAIRAHATSVMNAYFVSKGGDASACFPDVAKITTVDPSTPKCKYDGV